MQEIQITEETVSREEVLEQERDLYKSELEKLICQCDRIQNVFKFLENLLDDRTMDNRRLHRENLDLKQKLADQKKRNLLDKEAMADQSKVIKILRDKLESAESRLQGWEQVEISTE